jgi:hypothetical protein
MKIKSMIGVLALTLACNVAGSDLALEIGGSA